MFNSCYESPAIESWVNQMMRPTSVAGLGAALLIGALVLVSTAGGQVIRVGNLVLKADGGFSPRALPKHEDAPISLHGGGSLSTVNGDLPPVVETISIEFDRHGSVETAGLPICTDRQLEATTVRGARNDCPGAIVGEGRGRAIVSLPETRPIPVESPITLFNGPPKHGMPTFFAHAYTTFPVPTTFVIPVVVERIHKGVYGYRTRARIPRIAGGYGIPVAGHLKVVRKWSFKGRDRSYVNARCETGHLQARVEAKFKDGTYLSGVFIRACEVRR